MGKCGMTTTTKITPPEGRAHCYCPTCGMVATVISDGPDDLPWCLHHDSNYAWRAGGMESGWTPMKVASVEPA